MQSNSLKHFYEVVDTEKFQNFWRNFFRFIKISKRKSSGIPQDSNKNVVIYIIITIRSLICEKSWRIFRIYEKSGRIFSISIIKW